MSGPQSMDGDAFGRMKALELAIRATPPSATIPHVIEVAKQFDGFIKGDPPKATDLEGPLGPTGGCAVAEYVADVAAAVKEAVRKDFPSAAALPCEPVPNQVLQEGPSQASVKQCR